MGLSNEEIRALLKQRGLKLNPVATTEEVEAFEKRYNVRLPEEYRSFILTLGNGGAGPSYSGLWPLGTNDIGRFNQRELEQLHVVFDAETAEAWECLQHEWWLSPDVMNGTLTIATDGCQSFYCMVVTGAGAGEIWFDERGDGETPEQLTSNTGELLFREWYEDWLLST